MSPSRRNYNMHITLPPRHFIALTHSGASTPSSPSPHTPLPFEYSLPSSIATSSQESLDFGDFDASALAIGTKRAREEEVSHEGEWDDAEIATIESVLHHPPQHLRFAPNSLPEPSILDELTHHIIRLPPRTPTKRRPRSDIPSTDDTTTQWQHSWDATRKKLYTIALAESKFGAVDEDVKKLTRQEKLSRPGLKRMNSMDFLDEEAGEEKESDRIGRALRLSTTLQNNSKVEIIHSSPLLFDSPTSSRESSPEPPTSIMVTPASPVTIAPAPTLRRRGSHRKSQPIPRPSFLQRNRSFTATDLEGGESPEAPARIGSPTALFPSSADNKPSSHRAFFTASMADALGAPSTNTLPPFLSEPSTRAITRSHSSLTCSSATPNIQRDNFLQRQPISAEIATLAIPLAIGKGPVKSSKSDWSDSEDEGLGKKIRGVKKMKKGGKGTIARTLSLETNSGGLRSPFEEKEFQF